MWDFGCRATSTEPQALPSSTADCSGVRQLCEPQDTDSGSAAFLGGALKTPLDTRVVRKFHSPLTEQTDGGAFTNRN